MSGGERNGDRPTPEERRRFGAVRTPRPLALWIVRSVDALLRSRLGREGGLAEPGVRVLDPAAGDFNFLRAAWAEALRKPVGEEGLEGVRRHLLADFLGIEIRPRAWAAGQRAAARWLARCGAPLEEGERAPLLLADALADPERWTADGPFRAGEAAAAARAKREASFDVVLGNPPFAGHSPSHSPNRGSWATSLLHGWTLPDGRWDEGCFRVDGRPLPERNLKWIHDDTVKFLRLAQWLVERRGEGIVALVVNRNLLEAPTLRGLRRSLLSSFGEVYALDLHGDRRRREEAPGGGRDENVFPGIAQGAAVLLLVKRRAEPEGEAGPARVFRGNLHGERREKLRALAGSTVETAEWREVRPRGPLFPFASADRRREREYRRMTPLPEVFPVYSQGIVTGRDAEVVALDREELEEKLAGQPEAPAGWRGSLETFLVRPFDLRCLLYDRKALERPREAVMGHLRRGPNVALVASRQHTGRPGAFVSRWLAGHKVVCGYAPSSLFPLWLYPREGGAPRPNLGAGVLRLLAERYGAEPSPEEVLGAAYAALNHPGYFLSYGHLMRQEFPKIPFPPCLRGFRQRARLGWALIEAHLLRGEPPVPPGARTVGEEGPGGRKAAVYEAEAGRVLLGGGFGFEGVEPEVWGFRVGGRAVLPAWLRARARRPLGARGTLQFLGIAGAIRRTLEVRAEIARLTEEGETG